MTSDTLLFMSDTLHPSSIRRTLKLTLLAFVCASLGGCASYHFKSIRESHFIDMDAEVLSVQYGKEKRTETLPNGIVCTFNDKVRLHLPNGKSVVLYQAITTTGVRYVSANKRYEFHEKGPYCIVKHEGKTIFEGVFCRH